ncbi:Uncharacterized protein Adt_43878 [Abeliophyllum distichum]|uniref:Uncharacterized protein n=1 Tax=Abeliophyllum distichum TaxID=126358 RepID=A0ABD1P997_9LAMI
MALSKNPPDMMHELLRRRDKYVDAEEAFFITKGMKDQNDFESNKRKTWDEPKLRDDKENDEDLKCITCPHDYALVIVADTADFDVRRVLIDNGSVVDVMSWRVFLGLKIPHSKIRPVITPLHRIGRAIIVPEEIIELIVTLGTYPASIVIMTSFLLVKAHTVYNVIYGRPLLNTARLVVSTYHPVVKLPTSRDRMC